MPRRSIPRHHAPLGEFSPCVFRNDFFMHSPCYSLAIALTGEGLRSSNNEGGSEGTSAFSPRPVGRGGEGSPEGDVVAAARTRGKGRLPHPGGPPIYGGRRLRGC